MNSPSWIKAKGTQLVDEAGKPVLWRGFGLGNWLLPEGYMWLFGPQADRPRTIEKVIERCVGSDDAAEFWRRFRDTYTTRHDYELMKEAGANSVRLPFMTRVLMDEESGRLKEDGFKYLDNCIAACRDLGMWVILDLHGAPGGQTGSNIDDSPADRPELFEQDHFKEKALLLWSSLAKRYKDEPTVGGYDLLNEPLPAAWKGNDWSIYNDRLEPMYRAMTEAIREHDRRHMIILEGAHWSNDFSVFSKPFDSNLCYQFHKYWSVADDNAAKQYLDFRDKHQVPLWLGETGENSLAWFKHTYPFYESKGIGWNFWPWKKLDTQTSPLSIRHPKGWEKIVAASHDGPFPGREEAMPILERFLQNLPAAQCERRQGVLDALFGGKAPEPAGEGSGPGARASVEFEVPANGDYVLQLNCGSSQEQSQVALRLDGGEMEKVDVPYTHHAGSRWIQRKGPYALNAGKHRLELQVQQGQVGIALLGVTRPGAQTPWNDIREDLL